VSISQADNASSPKPQITSNNIAIANKYSKICHCSNIFGITIMNGAHGSVVVKERLVTGIALLLLYFAHIEAATLLPLDVQTVFLSRKADVFEIVTSLEYIACSTFPKNDGYSSIYSLNQGMFADIIQLHTCLNSSCLEAEDGCVCVKGTRFNEELSCLPVA
jgi:hypothetical protein